MLLFFFCLVVSGSCERNPMLTLILLSYLPVCWIYEIYRGIWYHKKVILYNFSITGQKTCWTKYSQWKLQCPFIQEDQTSNPTGCMQKFTLSPFLSLPSFLSFICLLLLTVENHEI